MKRRLIAGLILLCAIRPVAAAERWWDSYNRGVAAVNASNYKAAADALSKAIAEVSTESTALRAGNKIITYVPHFWLGIAKFNLGDVDGALRSWRTSEEQGAIARTEYYGRLKEWVARANAEKQRRAQNDASGSKKSADVAISRALATQGDALSAGGDRTESYRSAQRKLDEALAQFARAGTDIAIYRTAEKSAVQAAVQFAAAAEEGKKLRASRPSGVAANRPAVAQKPAEVSAIVVEESRKPVVETSAPVTSEAEVAASLAVQKFRRSVIDAAAKSRLVTIQEFLKGEARQADALRDQLQSAESDADFIRIAKSASDREAAIAKTVARLRATPEPAPPLPAATPSAPPPTPVTATASAAPVPSALRDAYLEFANGRLDASEGMLNDLIARGAGAEAYLLRGCARFTRATLSRRPEQLLAAATDDFKAALQRNGALRLETRTFSPKLVAFFDNVRRTR